MLLSGIVHRPLPPTLRLCSTEEEAMADVDKRSPAQLTRPHPRWRYLRNLLDASGAATVAAAALLGWTLCGFAAALALALVAPVLVLLCRILRRVWWSWGGADLCPRPRCAVDDAELLAASLPPWEQRMVVFQPDGYLGTGLCSWACFAGALRSLPGAAPRWIKYPRYKTYMTLDQGLEVVQSLCKMWPVERGRPSAELFGGDAAPLSLRVFREVLSTLGADVRLAVMFSIPALGPLGAKVQEQSPSFTDRLEKLPSAHWACIVGHIEERGLVILRDPRPRVGLKLVPVERLLLALNTTCCVTGKLRGLIRIRLVE